VSAPACHVAGGPGVGAGGAARRAGGATEVWVNGERHAVAARTVRALLAELGYDPDGRGVAVARNGEVVPRSAWDTTPVAPGDRIDVVGAVQGG
jgi:sulfur carrier protein